MVHHLLQKSGEKSDEFSDEFITLKSCAREHEKNINNKDEVNDVCFHALSHFRSLSLCDFLGNINKKRERERERERNMSLQHLAAEQRVDDDRQNNDQAAVGEQQQPTQEELGELLELIPLGAGSEVGRSCIVASFFEGKKNVMFDCGIHPGFSGLSSLPYFDEIDVSAIDVLLVTHFHLDHCAAVPFLVNRTNFKGRVFMTHATKAIFHMLMSDFVRLSARQQPKAKGEAKEDEEDESQLWDAKDLKVTMDKIEVIDFHQEINIDGIKVTPYRAGHVLGACQFEVNVGGCRVLYTGDYSRVADRHLPAADIPKKTPHVVIVESTYGVSPHTPKEEREARFTDKIHGILGRGGKCLLPVVALGRAQELLLILEDYWEKHPEMSHVPVYQASALARKAMTVFETYINVLNADIKRQFEEKNPFNFKHVQSLNRASDLDGNTGPCVVLATPSMLQSGTSRELFENWCESSDNGVVICDFAVQGTLAREILSDVKTVKARDGRELQLRCSVDAISFSAHADYPQTQQFLDILNPPHVVLVHGETSEMARLKRALEAKAVADGKEMNVFAPKNCQSVEIRYRGEKVAKVAGSLASDCLPVEGQEVRGVLVAKDFGHLLVAPEDVRDHARLRTSVVTQRQLIPCEVNIDTLRFALEALFEGMHAVRTLRMPKKSSFKNEEDDDENSPEEKKTEEKKSPTKGRKTKKAKNEVVAIKEEEDDDDKWEEGVSIDNGAVTLRKAKKSDEVGVEHVILEWASDPFADVLADATLSVVLQLNREPETLKAYERDHAIAMKENDTEAVELLRFKMAVAMLEAQFGKAQKVDEKTRVLEMNVDAKRVTILHATRTVACDEDESTRSRVELALGRIDEAIADCSYARRVRSATTTGGGGATAV